MKHEDLIFEDCQCIAIEVSLTMSADNGMHACAKVCT